MDSIPIMACLQAYSTSQNPSHDLSTWIPASSGSGGLDEIHTNSWLDGEDDWKSVALGKLTGKTGYLREWTQAQSKGPGEYDKRRLHPSCQDTGGVKAVTELDSRGSNQGSVDRDAKNQILDDGDTIHRFVSFKTTAKEFESQASFGLKHQDEFNNNNASCLTWLSPEVFCCCCCWIQESKS